MQYTDGDVFVYQLMDLLVCKYNYRIVNVPGGRRDVWLANENHEQFPMIRLTSAQSTSLIFEKEYLTKIKKALSTIIRTDKPLLIFNTHKDSCAFVEDEMIQVVVGDYFISDASLSNVFPGILQTIHKVENNQNECARLIRNLENDQKKKMETAKKFSWKNAPKVSIGLIVISAVLFVISSIITRGTSGETWLADMVICGGYYKSMVVYGKEYWRLLTTTFIHYDVLSLVFYALTLYRMGKYVEKHYGVVKYLILFLLSAVIGNTCVLVFTQNSVSIGLGSGLFGVLGAFILIAWETRMFVNPYTRINASQCILWSIASMFFSGAHLVSFLGGFITGIFLSIILSDNNKLKEFKPHFIVCACACIATLVYGVYTSKTAFPEFNELNTQIVEEYNRLGLANQAQYVDNYFKGAYEE